MLDSVKEWPKNFFFMKELVEPEYILGIKIYRDRPIQSIGLSERTYIDKILTKFKMENSKRGLHSLSLSKTQCPSDIDEIK